MPASDLDLRLDDLEFLPPSSPPRPPPRTSQKCPRKPNNDSNSDTNEEAPEITSGMPQHVVDKNVVAAARRLGTAKRLRSEQMNDLEVFLNDTAFGCEARLYIQGIEILSKVDKIVTNKPAWEVSKSMKKNIKHYVAAASLSTSLISYHSSDTINLICEKLLDLGLDLPDNIHQDAAALATLTKAVDEEFTQRWESMKKDIRGSLYKSIGKSTWITLPPEECQNIYELTHVLVKNTHCKVTPELCARVAILRRAFKKNSGVNYWIQVDATIEGVWQKGEYKKKKIARCVKHILEQDLKKYSKGVSDHQDTDEAQSDIQNEMDQLIEACHLKANINNNEDKTQDTQTGKGSDRNRGMSNSEGKGEQEKGQTGAVGRAEGNRKSVSGGTSSSSLSDDDTVILPGTMVYTGDNDEQ